MTARSEAAIESAKSDVLIELTYSCDLKESRAAKIKTLDWSTSLNVFEHLVTRVKSSLCLTDPESEQIFRVFMSLFT